MIEWNIFRYRGIDSEGPLIIAILVPTLIPILKLFSLKVFSEGPSLTTVWEMQIFISTIFVVWFFPFTCCDTFCVFFSSTETRWRMKRAQYFPLQFLNNVSAQKFLVLSRIKLAFSVESLKIFVNRYHHIIDSFSSLFIVWKSSFPILARYHHLPYCL